MPEFNPSPNQKFQIGGHPYVVMPHPAVPTFAFGQEGRKAMVFQVRSAASGDLYALKKFKQAFRLPELVTVCGELAQFAQWEGLEVCSRVCLHHGPHEDILAQHPDLEYAVLMPWITGTTWYDVVIGTKPLDRVGAMTFANAVAQVLAGLEEAGLAHCDISAANVIVNPVTERAHLIDVEDIYAPGFPSPAALPAGTDGYAHKTASGGLWRAEADRFAGAIMMCEMAAWHSPDIRRKADEEHYFASDEMHQDTPRYRLMRDVLTDLDPRLSELFEQAWFSDTLEDCPRLNIWQDVIEEVYRKVKLSTVVGGWRAITVPVGQQDASPRAFSAPEPAPQSAAPLEETDQEEPPAPAEPEPARAIPPAPAPQPLPSVPIQPAASYPVTPPPQRTPSRTPIAPPTDGGPVREWRPLGDIVTPSPVTSFEGGMRPITLPTQPEAEEAQANRPIQAPVEEAGEAPEPPFDEEPADIVEAELYPEEAALEDLYEGVLPEEAGAQTWDGWEQETSEDELAAADYDDAGIVDEALEEDAPEPPHDGEDYSSEPVAALEDDLPSAPVARLLKPVLDLSHVDRRNRPHLVWSESPDATHYLIQEARDSAFSDPKEIRLKAGDTRWSPLLGRTGRLYYRIRAENRDAGEAGPWSEALSLRIGD